MRFYLGLLAAGILSVISSAALAQKVQSAEEIAKALTPDPSIERTRSMARGISTITPRPLDQAQPQQALTPPHPMHIEFELNSDRLTPVGQQQVDQLAQGMNLVRTRSMGNKQYVFSLTGHTDRRGTPEYNRSLSMRRATAVREYLMTNWGMKRDLLLIDGRGFDELKNKQDPFASENRRVEVTTVREAGN